MTAREQAKAQGQDHQPPQNPLQHTPMGITLARRRSTPMRQLPSMDRPDTMTAARQASDHPACG
jgi:hypothetical protein